MPHVITRSGRRIKLASAPLGGGGQAEVFAVANDTTRVAKIFRPPEQGIEHRLEWMIAHPPQDPTRLSANHISIAWPEEILYEDSAWGRIRGLIGLGQGRCVGYLMPRSYGMPLISVINPSRRRAVCPAFGQDYLLRVAQNLASALSALHMAGYVVGDLNELNIRVTDTALVTIIDTDSFQVEVPHPNGQTYIYPCPVGRLEYTPPELQGQSFRTLVRAPEHDLFGLGVLIFQLLMGGSHPFRGRWTDKYSDPPSTEVKIAKGIFPWARVPRGPIEPPPGVPPPPLWLRSLLEECFSIGHNDPSRRPTATEWATAIARAEGDKIDCLKGHRYPRHLATCPECIRQQIQTPPSRGGSPRHGNQPTVPSSTTMKGALMPSLHTVSTAAKEALVGLGASAIVAGFLLTLLKTGGVPSPARGAFYWATTALLAALLVGKWFEEQHGRRSTTPSLPTQLLWGLSGWVAGWLALPLGFAFLLPGQWPAGVAMQLDGFFFGWSAWWLLYGCFGAKATLRESTPSGVAITGGLFGLFGSLVMAAILWMWS